MVSIGHNDKRFISTHCLCQSPCPCLSVSSFPMTLVRRRMKRGSVCGTLNCSPSVAQSKMFFETEKNKEHNENVILQDGPVCVTGTWFLWGKPLVWHSHGLRSYCLRISLGESSHLTGPQHCLDKGSLALWWGIVLFLDLVLDITFHLKTYAFQFWEIFLNYFLDDFLSFVFFSSFLIELLLFKC